MPTILRAVYAYFFLLIVLRLIGRRAIMQNSPFELILIFLFGGTMIQAVVGDDRSIVNASLAVMTIGLLHALVAYLKFRFTAVRKLVEGTAILMLSRGEADEVRMRRSRLQMDDLMTAARSRGIQRVEDIDYVVFERSGALSVIEKQSPS
jgi:uncharacterized membrane protein YcaP (DUF421 family)